MAKSEQAHMLSDKLELDRRVDAQTLAELRSLERIALGRTIKVESNGKFPHWTMERWMTVATFLTVVIGWLFFAGGEWTRVKGDIKTATVTLDAMSADVKDIRAKQVEGQMKVDALKVQIETIERSDEYYRTHPRPRPVLESGR